MLFLVIMLAVSALGVELCRHATKHGEATDIRRCLDQNGPAMVLKHRWDPTFYLVCQLGKDSWGFQAVDAKGFEKTSFSPRTGSFRDVMQYLERIATRYTGKLPWLLK